MFCMIHISIKVFSMPTPFVKQGKDVMVLLDVYSFYAKYHKQ
jgi:hypothetical protein